MQFHFRAWHIQGPLAHLSSSENMVVEIAQKPQSDVYGAWVVGSYGLGFTSVQLCFINSGQAW